MKSLNEVCCLSIFESVVAKKSTTLKRIVIARNIKSGKNAVNI